MACTACLVCFITTVNGRSKKSENALEDVALVAGTQQNLNNLYSSDINGYTAHWHGPPALFLLSNYVDSHHLTMPPQSGTKDQCYCSVC